ncbi:MAG: bidirectional hydrogenase complex protein HoxE [Candidatus Heimdallarchaeota archaeon]|nr:MAG: bidirectional hydrogenase complex protein HoxE [Candidatus Heimdallarchaeota archaeon]
MVREQKADENEVDDRWRLIERTMRKHGYQPSGLIEILHKLQEIYGYLERESLKKIATSLKVPLSNIYGVASFYHYFSLKPRGEHQCVVCLGTACYIKGSQAIVSELEKILEIKAGKTTPDKKVSLLSARCLGSCGLAPAGVFDGEVIANLSNDKAKKKIKEWFE